VRERNYSRTVDKVRDTLLWRGRKSMILLEGSQALPARASFWQGQCESEGGMMFRSGGLRQGPRNFGFLS
jgi:hypothetical protein